LPNGKVLIVGGGGGASAELYDAGTGRFMATGNLTVPRTEHTATLLPSGLVLIAGGYDGSKQLTSAERYDPAAGTFTANGTMTVPRYGHGAALLPSGMVLIAGGYVPVSVSGLNTTALASAELYDPKAGVFAATGRMGAGRSSPTTTLLPDGTVLIAGGQLGFEGWVGSPSLERYDPTAGTFASTGSMTEGRACYTATLLPSGLVLIAGGYTGGGSWGSFFASAELYAPAAGTCTATGNMTAEREFHTATLLANGTVLVAGGDSRGSALASAELYR
jgi:hypothetical protein